MDTFTFNLILLLFGGFIGVLFVMMILRAIRGAMWSHGGFPTVYPSDPYYRERSDWWGILLFFGFLAILSLLFTDGFTHLGKEASSSIMTREQHRSIPPGVQQQEVQRVVQGRMISDLSSDTTDTIVPETALPLGDYLTKDFFYIQYSSGGDLENMLEARYKLDLQIEELPFIAKERGQYKLLTGPYRSKGEAEVYAEESERDTYIRTGEGLDLFSGY